MAFRIFKRISEMLDVDFSTPPADGDRLLWDDGDQKWKPGTPPGGAGAPDDATYITQTAHSDLSAEQALSSLSTGLVKVTNGTGVLSTATGGTDYANASHSHAGEDISSGTVADARIASTIARDSEVTAAISAHESDTTSVHGIADTSALALTANVQPIDSDLTAIAALTTTAFGRGLLELANAAALLSAAGGQASDSDLTSIAGLSPSNDDIIQRKSGAWANRTLAQLMTDLGALGTTFQPLDSDLTSIAALTTTSYGRGLLAAAASSALPGGELDYVQFTSNVTISGTTAAGATTVVTANAVSFDGSTACIVEYFVPVVDQPTAGSLTVFVLYDGSTNLGRIGETYVAGTAVSSTNVSAVSSYGLRRLTPSNGSHTFSLRAWRVTANTTAQAGSGGTGDADLLPGFIRITRV